MNGKREIALTKKDRQLCRTGLIAFLLSGISAISSGVIVSLLVEKYSLSYGLAGTLLALMSSGAMAAGFVTGIMDVKLGTKKTAAILGTGYTIGFGLMAVTGAVPALMAAFLIVGFAKGGVMNICTILVGTHSENRAKGMTLMHSCYAFGALTCPFLLAFLAEIGTTAAILGVAAVGAVLWTVFMTAGLPGVKREKRQERADTAAIKEPHGDREEDTKEVSAAGDETAKKKKAAAKGTDLSFLVSAEFWILTALLFCQNGAEQSVNGWLVTYFKDQGILTGMLASYTITIMWGATFICRLLIAFVFPVRNIYRALSLMSCGCIALYCVLMGTGNAVPAALALFAFAFSMAGINPIAVSGVGERMNAVSMGIMLPIGGIGAIVMPFIIGVVGDAAGLRMGMAMNIVPCVGMLVFSFLMLKRTGKKVC